jgi:hypothetical protein
VIAGEVQTAGAETMPPNASFVYVAMSLPVTPSNSWTYAFATDKGNKDIATSGHGYPTVSAAGATHFDSSSTHWRRSECAHPDSTGLRRIRIERRPIGRSWGRMDACLPGHQQDA